MPDLSNRIAAVEAEMKHMRDEISRLRDSSTQFEARAYRHMSSMDEFARKYDDILEQLIEERQDKVELRKAIINKGITGATWALIVFLTKPVWQALATAWEHLLKR